MPDTKLDVRVYPIDEPQGSTKAFASISVNNTVAIRGIRVVEDKEKMFVTMPQSRDKKTGKYHDIAFPIDGDLRKEITNATLSEYDRVSNLHPGQRGYEKPEPDTNTDVLAENVKFDIRVYPLAEPQGNTKAFASVSIDDLVAIRGIRVVEGTDGLFVSMPQSQSNEKYHDVAFPLIGELRKEISAGILEKFNTEKAHDRKASLGNKLAEGTDKAAGHVAQQNPAAKSAPGIGA